MQDDGKTRRLERLCPHTRDALELARLVELTEFRAGTVVSPAGLAGWWCTRVVEGAVATTEPAARHPRGAVLAHGPQTALVALTDVVLLTASTRDADRLRALAPGLLEPTGVREPERVP